MADTAIILAPVTGVALNGGVGGSGSGDAPNSSLSASDWNSFRMSAVMDRLSVHLYGNRRSETGEFLNLCLSLARSIDFAIGNNEVPSRSQELPSLLKQVCQAKSDSLLQAAIMVLMISVKSACQYGWFSIGDSEELSNLAKEMGTNFCSVSNFNAEPNCHPSAISTIMSRFYPRIKIGQVLTFLEVKPGYDAYVIDFRISKNISCSPKDKIRLFVVQTDNMETSSCLVTPVKVNFLLNGREVEGRTNLSLDTGPQVPTTVNNLMKYGTNLLQAVGEFDGNYYITVAFMSEVSNPDNNALQDYEQPAPATVDADSEVIVGPSRISLNCPISFKKIKTPVKGHSCKHIQCFDFDNYVDINSRRPSWRCPHCNQHVCFTDIRVDQKLVKILKEAGPNVSDVIISSDGSWNAIMGNDDTVQKPEDATLNTERDESPQPADVMDLTEIDDAMNDVTRSETDGRKHLPDAQNFTTQSNGQDDFWSAMFLSTFGVGSSNVRPNVPVANVPVPTSVLTNSPISPVREGTLDTVLQDGTPLPNALQLQHYQLGNNPRITNEYGRFRSLPRNVTRTPIAVQALPAQTSTSHLQRSYTNTGNTAFNPNSRPAASQASPSFSPASRAHPHHGSPISSAPLVQHSAIQQNSTYSSARPPQRNASFQGPNTYRVPNATIRMPQATTQGPRLIQPSTQPPSTFLRPQTTQQSQLIAAANQAVQMSFEPSSVPPYSVTSPQPVAGTDLYDPTAEMNWRPAGRMRGALSGQAFAEAYNRAMYRPNQQVQAVRPIPNVTSVPTSVPAQSQAFAGIPAPSYSVSCPMGLDVLPGGSGGMN